MILSKHRAFGGRSLNIDLFHFLHTNGSAKKPDVDRFRKKHFLFENKRGINRFSGSGLKNHRKLLLKISTINLRRTDKLNRGEKDRHFQSTE